MSRAEDGALVNEWAMAACYSTDPDGTVRLPFDPVTAELVPDVWERWLRWDPVRMARTPEGRSALHSLRAIWIDAGTRDEYFLDMGAEAFRRACVAAGAPESDVAAPIEEFMRLSEPTVGTHPDDEWPRGADSWFCRHPA